MEQRQFKVGFTFDDLLLIPGHSAVLPGEVDVRSRLSRNIQLSVPIVSAAMDTVTESATAITMARQGGIGFVHKNMSIERQALEVEKVKKSESGMIVDPISIEPDRKLYEVMEIMSKYRISGVPVVKKGRLVGIITNRDLRFETNLDQTVAAVMTKDNLATARPGITPRGVQGHSARAENREAPGGGRRGEAHRVDHDQGHREDQEISLCLQG